MKANAVCAGLGMTALALGLASRDASAAEAGTFTVRALTPETALKAAQAAMAKCRTEGFQVTVAVVDRSGVTQVVIRDRFAPPHTAETAQRKAATAVNFKMPTSELDRELQAGRPTAGIRQLPGVVAIAGGVPIEAAGSLVGAIGVSGAPGPANDERCAQGGIRAIAEDLEF
ncbi:MAG TPA: heme-binding protein [Usitatibacter sp.]|nr:heme-binding protein [Usitatibacter sp.]